MADRALRARLPSTSPPSVWAPALWNPTQPLHHDERHNPASLMCRAYSTNRAIARMPSMTHQLSTSS